MGKKGEGEKNHCGLIIFLSSHAPHLTIECLCVRGARGWGGSGCKRADNQQRGFCFCKKKCFLRWCCGERILLLPLSLFCFLKISDVCPLLQEVPGVIVKARPPLFSPSLCISFPLPTQILATSSGLCTDSFLKQKQHGSERCFFFFPFPLFLSYFPGKQPRRDGLQSA